MGVAPPAGRRLVGGGGWAQGALQEWRASPAHVGHSLPPLSKARLGAAGQPCPFRQLSHETDPTGPARGALYAPRPPLRSALLTPSWIKAASCPAVQRQRGPGPPRQQLANSPA